MTPPRRRASPRPRPRAPHHFPAALLTAAVLAVTLLPGCGLRRRANDTLASLHGPGARVTLTPAADPDGQPPVDLRFDHAWYASPSKDQATLVLLQGTPEAPRHAMVLNLFWTPVPGRTPIASGATNATFRLLLFSDDARPLAAYRGAGFLLPRNLASPVLVAELLEAHTRLAAADPSYADPVGPAVARASIHARLDPQAVQRLERALSLRLLPPIEPQADAPADVQPEPQDAAAAGLPSPTPRPHP